ncbi:hypothetical protein AB1Y20_022252 [Prymnesium parvum]|uniref:Serine aminopeptidase S33 domain-containing protein n=1 Tax=Prymnesium parvum TaxID=97485 RepID=A0AB34JGN8_PRYPA
MSLPTPLVLPSEPAGSSGEWSVHGTYYELNGPADAPLVLLIHGIGFSLHTFDLLEPELARAGFRTLRYDWVGVGKTAPAKHNGMRANSSYTLDGHVRQLCELIEDLNTGPPAAICAHSLGATVAMAFAARHGCKLHSLVLLAPAGAMAPPFPGFSTAQGLIKAFSCCTLPVLAHALSGPPPPGDIILDAAKLRAVGLETAEASALDGWVRAWHREGTRPRPLVERMVRMPICTLTSVVKPALVGEARVLVWAAKADPTVRFVKNDYYQACFRDCTIEPMHALGHCFHLQDAARVNRRIVEFLTPCLSRVRPEPATC